MFLNNYFFLDSLPEILQRTQEHFILVFYSTTISIGIGIPLGILITRYQKLAPAILALANGIQTIPSLAIFGFLISVPFFGGIGPTPAIVALTLYALLPLIRNTYTGIMNVDPEIKEAGRAMGMTNFQLLFQVEIPLAFNVILTGIRIATVINVGITTIAAAIGAGGLGVFIFRGISTVDNQLILTGAIPSAILALIADLAFSWLEKYFTGKKRVFNYKFLISIGLLTFLLIVFLNLFQNTLNPDNKIVIGSKNFTEQVILAELLSQQIEANTDLKVDRIFNLGGTFICHEALKNNKINGYVEYTGTAFTAILKENPISDPQLVYQQVKQRYLDEFKIEVMPPLGFENTFAVIVRQEDAVALNLKNISDLNQYASQFKAAFDPEFVQRKDGYKGFAQTYQLKFASQPQELSGGLRYQAISKKQVDVIVAASTDGLIPTLNLVILSDDKKYFPPYEPVPIFNRQTIEKHPEIMKALSPLFGNISARQMQEMNYQIEGKSLPVQEVVANFIQNNLATQN